MHKAIYPYFSLAIMPMAMLGFIPGCGDRVASSAALKSCPCPATDVCCGSGVCAAREDMCEATTSRLSALNQGTWQGYVENYSFQSGSDDLRVIVDVDTNGTLNASVILGGSMAPPLPNDPNLGWPTGYSYGSHGGLEYVEGFVYPAADVHWESLRLKMKVATDPAWQQWCELQTPFHFPSLGTYLCVPPGSKETASLVEPCSIEAEPPISVECSKLSLCWLGACVCDAEKCAASDVGANVFLDVSLNGDRGDGSIRLGSPDWVGSKIYNVRLTRSARGN